jgi:ABC-2 type transport system permease protein
MVPLEVFPPTMRRIADATPHAWGNEAFHSLVDRGEGWLDVLPQVGVLLAFAAVLVGLAAWSLRRAITR